jgi:hypothetical protein
MRCSQFQTFWFTSVYHMDDDQELSFGFGIVVGRDGEGAHGLQGFGPVLS